MPILEWSPNKTGDDDELDDPPLALLLPKIPPLLRIPSKCPNFVRFELFVCINEFETKSRKLRHEFKSKIYSIVVDNGVECFYEAYDKGDHDCLNEFLIPRVKHELCHIDAGEQFEISCYDDIIEHIRNDDGRCFNFYKIFINYSKTSEGFILISF